MALTQEQIQSLRVGQPLRLTTFFGLRKYYLDAKVVVIAISTVACIVKVTEILGEGQIVEECDWKRLVVTFGELEILPE